MQYIHIDILLRCLYIEKGTYAQYSTYYLHLYLKRITSALIKNRAQFSFITANTKMNLFPDELSIMEHFLPTQKHNKILMLIRN